MHNIQIDSEFQALIPPLSAEERAQLEANLLADGCRDPLVVWPCATFDIRLDGGAMQTLRYEDGRYQHAIDEHIGPTTAWDLDDNADDDRIDEYGDTITLDQWPHILIDGHNRYEICTRLGLPFEVVVKEFAGRDEVVLWMCVNQLGRRNINIYDRGLLALRMKGIVEAKAKANHLANAGDKTSEAARQKSDAPLEKIRTDKEVAKLAEISHDTIRKIEKINAIGSPDLVQAVRSGDISINLASDLATLEKDKQNAIVGSGKKVAQEAVKAIKQEQASAKKEARREVINAQVEAISQGTLEQPQGLFDVIAIDPPWNYGREYDPDTSRVANPYPEMTQEQIKAIELPANDDAVLFLWTTHQFLFDAKELLDHWGFTYKATMVWDKERIGMGAWLRMQCEFCLVGIKGSPFWDNTEHRDIIREARREHSRKPEAFYTTVEKITAGRRLEYFARSAHQGWEVFGNDTSKF